jgi:hypothetical protein
MADLKRERIGIMSILNDAPSHQSNEESLKSLRTGVGRAGKLHNVAAEAITLRSKSLCPDHSVITLTLLGLAREVANGVGVETIRKAMLEELDRSIANLIGCCRAATQDSPNVQTQCAANIEIAPSPATPGLAAQSLMLGTIGEKLRDIAAVINGHSTAEVKGYDGAGQPCSDRRLTPSTSPLTGVISYSSSLNECWFW